VSPWTPSARSSLPTASRLELELVAIEADEGVSAKTLRRPGVQRALAALEEGRADALLVTKLDRLTRSVRDLGDLVDRYFADGSRWSLLSVGDSIDTKTAAGRLVLNVLASVAQWEREATGERTRDALAEVRRQGGTLGGEALGWRRGRRPRRGRSPTRGARGRGGFDRRPNHGAARDGSHAARHRRGADRGGPRDEAGGAMGAANDRRGAGPRRMTEGDWAVLELVLRAMGAFRANDNDGDWDHDHEDEDHEDRHGSHPRGRRRARSYRRAGAERPA
jgi:hypothetical protein